MSSIIFFLTESCSAQCPLQPVQRPICTLLKQAPIGRTDRHIDADRVNITAQRSAAPRAALSGTQENGEKTRKEKGVVGKFPPRGPVFRLGPSSGFPFAYVGPSNSGRQEPFGAWAGLRSIKDVLGKDLEKGLRFLRYCRITLALAGPTSSRRQIMFRLTCCIHKRRTRSRSAR